MRMQVAGITSINFQNNAGEIVKGHNLYVLFPDENVDGLKAEKLFVKEGIELPKDFKVQDVIEVTFNIKGRVEKITKA